MHRGGLALVFTLGMLTLARADGTARPDVAVLEPAPPPAAPYANPMPGPCTAGDPACTVPEATVDSPAAETLHPQIQIDGGLSVIGPAYEHPITSNIAIQIEAFVFGTYFLPWFDAGQRVKGLGGGIRPTWFRSTTGRGLYVAPYLRIVAVDDESLTAATDVGFTTGFFVGWAFGLTKKLDLRIGGGLQYIRFESDVPDARITTSTPFVALDAVLGYRL